MARIIAKVGNTVVADSSNTLKVEGNYYFPESDVEKDFLSDTDLETVCHWKGSANYYSLNVGGEEHVNAAWTYHEPKTKQAEPIKDMIAFYPNVVNFEEKNESS